MKDAPAFRCTNSEVTVQPSPYLSYRLPKDFVDLSTGEDAHKLIDFLKLATLWVKVPLEGALTPLCIVRDTPPLISIDLYRGP